MSRQRLHEVTGFALVTADLPRLVAFYTTFLGFARACDEQEIEPSEMALLGLAGGGRRQLLTLGDQLLAIDCFEARGQPYPGESDAASLWFQHLALVVTDMADAHRRLGNISSISTHGPQTLPPSSGGVQAFKFRDLDGHPIELLRFPDNEQPAKWARRRERVGQIGLGIDHSAISVADADASAAFYRALGLEPGERTINHGKEQQHLDDLRHVEVEVVPMKPRDGVPHLELLGYQVPTGTPGGPRLPNDICATRILWRGVQEQLLFDPDGHLHQVQA